MKKIATLITFLIVLYSCSNDDSPSTTNGNIIGTWIATSVDYAGQSIIKVPREDSITQNFVGEGYNIDWEITFNDSPKIYTSNGNYSVKLTTMVGGQSYSHDEENLEFLQNDSWNQIGTKLILNSQGVETEAVIEKLTDEELNITYETIEETSVQGMTVTRTIILRATFVRDKN